MSLKKHLADKLAVRPAAEPELPPPAEDADSRRPRSAAGSLFFAQGRFMEDKAEIDRLKERLAMYEGTIPTKRIGLDQIADNPYQPRIIFDPVQLDELASSIEQSGLLQPVAVRPGHEEGRYILIAGDRRRQAVQRLGWTEIDALIFEIDEGQAALASIAENLSRENLTDFEKYGIFKRLKDEGIVKTHAELATKLGVARQLVSFVFAYDRLPERVLVHLRENPRLLGATAAQQFAAWHTEKKTDLVCEAIELLAAGTLEHQAAAIEWVKKRLRTPQPREVRSFASAAGKHIFSLRQAPRQITVSLASGLPSEVLQRVADKFAAALEEAARDAHEAS